MFLGYVFNLIVKTCHYVVVINFAVLAAGCYTSSTVLLFNILAVLLLQFFNWYFSVLCYAFH